MVRAPSIDRAREAGARLVELVGRTPLLRLERLAAGLPGVTLLAKAEWVNPGGSVKDRAALRMIEEGERSGQLTRDKTILDATSGNTGIAYAWIGAARGYRVELCLPASASAERKATLRALGARLVETPALEGSDGAILEARRRYAADPQRYFYPDQYANPANWRAHYDGTGVEILEQTGGRLTHFVAALGTTGTFIGTGRRLKEADSRIRLVAVQPDSPWHGLEGMKHLPSALVPAIYDPTVADETIWMPTEEAQAMVRRAAREEGLLIGPSGGAALAAALRVARAAGPGAVVVTILPDSGARYLSERFWQETGE
ncbi:MAG TPA: cysteine synthase family protein [Thermodesulfobacteriota bacterium]|nr:cysteine synthase family protein [Thermodesulfobacteriota bacterium]